MSGVITTVRIPAQVKAEAELLVERGLFKNFSDVVLAGLRHELDAHEAMAARESVWADYLSKAGGDAEKASKLYLKDAAAFQRKHAALFKRSP